MRNELEFEYNEVTDEDDFKLMVIGGLTDDYEALQSQLEYDFDKMGSGLSLRKIKAQIRIRYSKVKVDISSTAFSGYKRRFKGSFHHCRKQGHKKDNCWDLKKIKRMLKIKITSINADIVVKEVTHLITFLREE